MQFNIVLGILLAYLSNFIIENTLPEDIAWRWMFLVMAFPAIIFFLLLCTVPETPRWLFQAGRRDEAVEVVRRTTQSREEGDFEIREIEEALAKQHGQAEAPFFVRQNRKVIMLAVAIAAFNQLHHAILYYAPDIFRMAARRERRPCFRASHRPVTLAHVIALTVIDKIGAASLWSVDRLPRQPGQPAIILRYDGQFSGVASVLVLGACVIAAHAFGHGLVIWVFHLGSSPTASRGRGSRLAADPGCSPRVSTPSLASRVLGAAGFHAVVGLIGS